MMFHADATFATVAGGALKEVNSFIAALLMEYLSFEFLAM